MKNIASCTRAALLIILALSGAIIPFARAQTFGSVTGTVKDSSGAVVVGAKVTAENIANGVARTVPSNQDGLYSFPTLEPGEYRITVEASGFSTEIKEHTTINATVRALVDFSLHTGAVSEVVQVTGTTPEIDKETAALGTTLDSRELQNLPINGRDYARFSLMVPGAVLRSNFISDLSFDGMQTVHNQFSIDGIDASRVDQPYMANGYERGARLLTGSLDTISEFRVQTSGYEAEYGRAAGSLVNIVTKSGSKQLHGAVYDYLRNDAFDASNFFATRKPEFRFNDFGGNLSGPIGHRNTFYFLNYEGSRQVIGITGSGTVPSLLADQEALATSPSVAPLVAQMPTTHLTPTSDPLISNYVVTGNSNVREDTGSVRVDQTFTDRDTAFVRLNINDSLVNGVLFGVYPDSLGVNDYQLVPIRTTNLAIHEEHIFNPNFLNDALVGFQRWASDIDSQEPVPATTIVGLTINPGSEANYIGANTSIQFGDNMTYVKGKHTYKWGGNAYRLRINSKSTNFDTIQYNSIQDFIDNSLAVVSNTVGDPGHGTRATQFGLFAQDSYKIRARLTINYGVRWDAETVPHDSRYQTQTFNQQTNALAPPGFAYFQMNKRNFAPRVGLAWSPSDKLVFRGSFGTFYQDYPVGFGSYDVPLNNIPGNYTLLGTEIPTLSYPFTSFVNEGVPPPATVYGFTTVKPDIYSNQWNISAAYELTPTTALQLAYVGNHGVNIGRTEDINYYDPTLGSRPNTNFSDIFLMMNTGFSSYNGLQVSVIRRVAKGLHANLQYTLGHAIDNVQDQGSFATEPQDNNNIKAERGNGSGDIRHNFTASGIYDIPMGSGYSFLDSSPAPIRLLVSGWQLNTLGLFHSGVAATVLIATNTSGNEDYTNQRPNFVPGQPRYAPNKSWQSWFNPNAWSLPANGTFGNSSRNDIYGPTFKQIDASLIKQTPLTEGKSIEFRAEFFNVLNHPNFAEPDTTYGTEGFGQTFNTFGATIGFGTPRQIQLALKFMF
jgi:Carboxypeptidase regulatory-like domain/TonB dependent receptor